jgi:cellobiose PTS system EIIC component
MKVSTFLEEKIMPIGDKIGRQKHLSALRDGMVATVPMTIIGGISLIVSSPPIDPTVTKTGNIFIKFLLSWANWANNNQDAILTPFYMTMALMAIFVAAAVSYSLAKRYKIDGLSSAFISIIAFLLVSSSSKSVVLLENVQKGGDALKQVITALPSDYFDSKGVFAAIIVGLLTVEITRFVSSKGFTIKMPEGVPPAVAKSFESLIPMMANVAIFYTISLILMSTTGMNVPQAVMKVLSPVISGVNSLGGMLLITFICQIFWMIGIHGGNITDVIAVPIATALLMENASARAAGHVLPQIFAQPFRDFFINIGGCGATFALALLYLVSKSKQLKTLGKLAIGPAIFNINEPLVFGSPIVLNPILGIPYIVVPLVNTCIAYFSMRTNLVGRAFAAVPWTTPAFVAGGLSTMDIKASLLIIALIIIDLVIYFPFFKMFEKEKLKEESELQAS